MRIAILTQPLRTNYGGILQNYALQQCLKGMGHEVYTLDCISRPSVSATKLLKRLAKVALGKVPASYLMYERRYLHDYEVFTRHTRAFVRNHIDLYPYADLHKDLTAGSFDAYVVGSDQVWRPEYNNINEMFLDFAEGWPVKRIAYAASFGSDSWEFSPGQTNKCALLAGKFDAISVRESSGIALCREHLGVDAVKVLDPSMLLSRGQYASLVDNTTTKPCEGNLFEHILDRTPEKEHIVNSLAARYGATVFTCNQAEPEGRIELPLEKRIQPPVEQWLRSFMDADYVVTDSFHATVFSILFNKPFLVLENPDRGLTRIQSLLKALGLEKCLICGETPELFPEIDYLSKIRLLDQLRQESEAFLNRHLACPN